jgi:virulence factor Mce-like protein
MKVSKAMLIKVMVFAAIAAVMTVALGVKLANSRLFADTYLVKAEFEDATGVLLGDSVKLAGVDIGRVKGTEIKDGKAIITFNLDKSVELPTDSQVAIRWRNVLGQRFIYVYPGDDNELFAEGDTIPSEQTKDVNDIGTFLNRLGPVLKAIDPDEANAFLDSVNTALQGNEKDVRELLDDGAVLAETLAGEDENIKDLIGSADEIMAAFASQDDALGKIFDDLDTVGTMLERRIGDVNTLVTDFSDVQRELYGIVNDNADSIDSTISSLDTVAGVLAKNRKNLSETLHTMPLGVSGYYQTTSWGEFFNVRLVALQFRDTESNVIADERENETQRGQSGGSPKVGDGAKNGYTKDEDGDDRAPRKGGGSGDGSRSTSERHATGAQGIETLLRFVLTGGGR